MTWSEKLIPPVARPTTGIITSDTREPTIAPKAPPMITPTAMSTTLPFMAKALNSEITPMSVGSSAGVGGRTGRAYPPGSGADVRRRGRRGNELEAELALDRRALLLDVASAGAAQVDHAVAHALAVLDIARDPQELAAPAIAPDQRAGEAALDLLLMSALRSVLEERRPEDAQRDAGGCGERPTAAAHAGSPAGGQGERQLEAVRPVDLLVQVAELPARPRVDLDQADAVARGLVEELRVEQRRPEPQGPRHVAGDPPHALLDARRQEGRIVEAREARAARMEQRVHDAEHVHAAGVDPALDRGLRPAEELLRQEGAASVLARRVARAQLVEQAHVVRPELGQRARARERPQRVAIVDAPREERERALDRLDEAREPFRPRALVRRIEQLEARHGPGRGRALRQARVVLVRRAQHAPRAGPGQVQGLGDRRGRDRAGVVARARDPLQAPAPGPRALVDVAQHVEVPAHVLVARLVQVELVLGAHRRRQGRELALVPRRGEDDEDALLPHSRAGDGLRHESNTPSASATAITSSETSTCSSYQCAAIIFTPTNARMNTRACFTWWKRCIRPASAK